MQIRFLPSEDVGIYWMRRILPIKVMCPIQKPVSVMVTINALEQIGTTWKEPPFSPHRSKRQLKKIRRKTAYPLYADKVSQLRIPEAVARAIREKVK